MKELYIFNENNSDELYKKDNLQNGNVNNEDADFRNKDLIEKWWFAGPRNEEIFENYENKNEEINDNGFKIDLEPNFIDLKHKPKKRCYNEVKDNIIKSLFIEEALPFKDSSKFKYN